MSYISLHQFNSLWPSEVIGIEKENASMLIKKSELNLLFFGEKKKKIKINPVNVTK